MEEQLLGKRPSPGFRLTATKMFSELKNRDKVNKLYGKIENSGQIETINFWANALERVHKERFKSATIKYNDLVKFFTIDKKEPMLKSLIRYYQKIGEYEVYRSIEKNLVHFEFNRYDPEIKESRYKGFIGLTFTAVIPKMLKEMFSFGQKKEYRRRNPIRGDTLSPNVYIVNNRHLRELYEKIIPTNSDNLQQIFQKKFLLRKTDFLSLTNSFLLFSTEDAKIILFNLLRDRHVFEIKIKDLATGNLMKYYSMKPEEDERCQTELAKLRLQQQFSMLKGVLRNLEQNIFVIDKRVKRAFTEHKITKETGTEISKAISPTRFKRALLNEMRKKKRLLAKIAQVEKKKLLIDKAIVDLDTKIDNGDFAECLVYLNKIKDGQVRDVEKLVQETEDLMEKNHYINDFYKSIEDDVEDQELEDEIKQIERSVFDEKTSKFMPDLEKIPETLDNEASLQKNPFIPENFGKKDSDGFEDGILSKMELSLLADNTDYIGMEKKQEKKKEPVPVNPFAAFQRDHTKPSGLFSNNNVAESPQKSSNDNFNKIFFTTKQRKRINRKKKNSGEMDIEPDSRKVRFKKESGPMLN